MRMRLLVFLALILGVINCLQGCSFFTSLEPKCPKCTVWDRTQFSCRPFYDYQQCIEEDDNRNRLKRLGSHSGIQTKLISVTAKGPTEVILDMELSWNVSIDQKSRNTLFIERAMDTGSSLNYELIDSFHMESSGKYTDTSVSCDRIYYYRVRSCLVFSEVDVRMIKQSSPSAVAPIGPSCTEWSKEVSVVTLSGPPDSPGNLSAVSVTRNSISIKWDDLSVNEKGFIIERCTCNDSTYLCENFKEVGRVKSNITEYKDTNLSHATRYRYQLRAYNDFGVTGAGISTSGLTE